MEYKEEERTYCFSPEICFINLWFLISIDEQLQILFMFPGRPQVGPEGVLPIVGQLKTHKYWVL